MAPSPAGTPAPRIGEVPPAAVYRIPMGEGEVEVMGARGLDVEIIGVDWARGSGPEGPAEVNAHGPAVEFGGGTMAGLLHRNLIACDAADAVHLLIDDSVSAARLFPDESLAWVHLDARHAGVGDHQRVDDMVGHRLDGSSPRSR